MSNLPDRFANLSPLKRAVLALTETQERLAALEQARSEPIAIIGVGCRLPGGVQNPQDFWRLLHDGICAVDDVPADRWDAEAWFDPDPDAVGRIVTRRGNFISGIDQFDPQFFGISPREAQTLDPQQRLALEVAWEAIEDAGLAPGRLVGSETGVFVGVCNSDYADILKGVAASRIDAYHASGIAHSMVSGRLSYVLGLQGPSVSIDTACSSSLVSIHLACQSLRSGDCVTAIAGGVNLILTPRSSVIFSRSRMLAADGRCKAFDAAADGFGRGEGCVLLVLKRYSDAIAAGDRVLALIRGSAVNQDGPSSGLTAPNGPAQEAVIRQALKRAGLEPGDVDFVETHGTGTSLGDPIEAQALGAVFGPARQAGDPLAIGSVKTNIGHVEAAAGAAGLLKLVLALQHRQIPPHLHLNQLNPHVAWQELPIAIPTTLTPWAQRGRARVGGVSSFGFSGTNAHIILEEAPPQPDSPCEATLRPHVFTVSARSPKALQALTARYAASLATATAGAPAADICRAANAGRAHFGHRLALIANSTEEFAARLAQCAAGEIPAGSYAGAIGADDRPRVAFLFSGQGAQYLGMGARLYDSQPVFRRALDRCAEVLANELDVPLLALLFDAAGEAGASARIDQTRYTQPALFAVEWALAELWRSWGVQPSMVMGHSVGEYVAATVAGVFSLEDGLRLIAARGRLMQAQPPGGRMAAVFADEAIVARVIASHGPSVAIAAVNGPAHTVVSGAGAEVQGVLDRLSADGISSKDLVVSHAFHSSLMDPLLDEFERIVSAVPMSHPRIKLVSNLTGQVASPAELTDAKYWRAHCREAVRFSAGIETLTREGCQVFVEIGPRPVLTGMGARCLTESAAVWLPSLRPGHDEAQTIFASLGQMYVHGVDVDWPAVDSHLDTRRIALPTYPFERQAYWVEGSTAGARGPQADGQPAARTGGHPLLGRRVRTATREIVFESELSVAALPFLGDHVVHGVTVLPMTAYLEMAIAAGREHFGTAAPAIEQMSIHRALVIPDDASRVVQVVLDPAADGVTFRVLGEDEADGGRAWVLYANGTLRPEAASEPVAADEPRGQSAERVDIPRFYEALHARGLQFGPRFRGLRALARGDGKAIAEVGLDIPVDEQETYRLHPAQLDACVQALAAADAAYDVSDEASDIYMPILIDRFVLTGVGGARLTSIATLDPINGSNAETRTGHIRVVDDEGRPVARLDGLRLKRVNPALLKKGGASGDDWLYRVDWQQAPTVGPATAAASLADPAAIARAVDRRIVEMAEANGVDIYDRLNPALESLAAAFIVKALGRLGCSLRAGDRLSVARGAALGVAPRYQRLFARLLDILAEDGILRREGDEWLVAREPVGVDPSALAEAMRREFANHTVELDLTVRCGALLAESLRGETDPLQLLFPGGDLEAASRVYDSTPLARTFQTAARDALQAAVATLPPSGRLRVLEIGAGTGGTTSYLLDALPADRCDYVFTDQGQAFLLKAAQRFAQYPFVRYQALDIERDPVAQGFDPHQFDVVIASNVLHATRDLKETLTHAGRLLAPSGLMLLLEATRPQRWFDLTFGLTPGWWRFDDAQRRQSYPLLSGEQWIAALAEAGFTAGEAIPRSAGLKTWTQSAVIVARGADTVTRTDAAGSWIVLCDEGGLGDAVADRLESRGGVAVRVAQGAGASFTDGRRWTIDPSNPDDFTRLVRECEAQGLPACRGAIHLWALDAGADDAIDGSGIMQSQNAGCRSALYLAQAAAAHSHAMPGLWLTTRGSQRAEASESVSVVHAPIWGLARTMALEHPGVRCVCVDLAETTTAADVDSLVAEMLATTDEDRVALRPDTRYVARLRRTGVRSVSSAGEETGVKLEIATPGTVDGLALRPVARRLPGEGEVEIRVQAAGLNFRDVMNVLAMRADPEPLGGECAGVITAVGTGVRDFAVGDEVVAIATAAFGTFVTTGTALLFHKPASLVAADAATVPLAFLTAEYALAVAGMRAGERILIHAAAGGVGLAAVQLARKAGLEVYATAGSDEKRQYLRSLGLAAVMDSRSIQFADEVAALTNGEGVDIVLNSLTGAAIERSLLLLRQGGRFLEIGKAEVWDRARAQAVNPAATYLPLDLSPTLVHQPEQMRPILTNLLARFERGELSPLPKRVFDLERASDAFRHMARARHIGKVVLAPRTADSPQMPTAFQPDGSYLITGGLSGLGLLVAGWMVARGARHLALMGRTEPAEDAKKAIERMHAAGARVVVVRGDVSIEADVRATLREMRDSLPPLRGIIHSAGVLHDGVLLQQDWERFERVLGPKVEGAWHLHRLTRELPLDFFVMFSSISSVLGSPGQANHAAANAFLDALAHHRRAQSLPALSINWGAWSKVGAAARRGADRRVGGQGVDPFSPADGLAALDRLFASPHAQVAVVPVSWPKFLAQLPGARRWPFFTELAGERPPATGPAGRTPASSVAAPVQPELLQRLEAAAPAKRQHLLVSHVQDTVVAVLALDRSRPLDRKLPLSEMGMDSLMAVELRNILGSSLGRTLPATLLFDFPTVTAVAGYLADLVLEAPRAPSPTAAPLESVEPSATDSSADDVLDRMENLSDEEIDRMLERAKGVAVK